MEEAKATVKISESFSVKIARIFNTFDLTWEGTMFWTNFNDNEVYKLVKGTELHVSFFGLRKRNVSWEKRIKLGKFKQETSDSDISFYVYGEVNMPLAKSLADNISKITNKSIVVMLVRCQSEKVENCQDDSTWLNTRREFLEKEQRRIESELTDVHKKLQALEGDGPPYRRVALSAVE